MEYGERNYRNGERRLTPKYDAHKATWLLANKQILVEGLEQLQRKAHWICSAYPGRTKFDVDVTSTLPWLTPFGGHSLDFGTSRYAFPFSDAAPPEPVREEISDVNAQVIRHLGNGLTGFSRWKSLRLVTTAGVGTKFCTSPQLHSVDLSALEIIGQNANFKRLDFRLDMCFWTDYPEYIRDRAKEMYCTEIERVSRVIMKNSPTIKVSAKVSIDRMQRLVWDLCITRP